MIKIGLKLVLGFWICCSVAKADVLDLQYIKTDMGGGTYQYDFKLILTNADLSWAPGQGWNWIIFGDVAFPGPSTLDDFVLLSETFPNPNMNYTTSGGGHNGPTFLDTVNIGSDGWIPIFVGDFVTWSGTSAHNVPDGALLFSTLIPFNGANAANFQVANAVPEPASIGVLGVMLAGACLVLRKRN